MHDLDGKAAVVTGAADGIGLALSRALAAEGMDLVMADIDAERLARAADEVQPLPGRSVITVPTDVSDPSAVRELERRARSAFGGVRLLCNNAGVQLPGRVWKVAPEDFAWLFGVNLWGVVHGIQAFVPPMLEQDEPAHIVNTASIGGILGFPRIGAYVASKFAVVGLSESLLLDLRERGASIGVSVLCPGAVATGLGANSERLRGSGKPSVPSRDVDKRTDDGDRLAPDEVAAHVVRAVRANRFWVLTHSGYSEILEARLETMLGGAESPAAPGLFQ
jgi:NAD(P)-dependent dehydrogenase (short-subunit alcohol dehydrogenase family)